MIVRMALRRRTTRIKFCLWMILMKGLMDAIKHMRKLDDMNHDSHLDAWM